LLGNNTGEYATSPNWSAEIRDECNDGRSAVDEGRLKNGNRFSSKTTSQDM
jgi:hypothetical protein